MWGWHAWKMYRQHCSKSSDFWQSRIVAEQNSVTKKKRQFRFSTYAFVISAFFTAVMIFLIIVKDETGKAVCQHFHKIWLVFGLDRKFAFTVRTNNQQTKLCARSAIVSVNVISILVQPYFRLSFAVRPVVKLVILGNETPKKSRVTCCPTGPTIVSDHKLLNFHI